jgi:hypothetical protein
LQRPNAPDSCLTSGTSCCLRQRARIPAGRHPIARPLHAAGQSERIRIARSVAARQPLESRTKDEMPDHRRTIAATVLTIAFLALPATVLGHPRAKVKTPVIVAQPASAMINTNIKLRGRGFPKNTTVQLRECGRRSWQDPVVPCNRENEISVATGAKGRFKVTFKVELCPEGEPLEMITQRACFIGVPQSGEDTGTLEPAVEVTVSYP